MTPNQLAKSGTEHAHQTALFAWCAVARIHGFDVADAWAEGAKLPAQLTKDEDAKVPELEWFHAIHNQGHGDKVRGGMAKAEGVRKGIADTFLPVPRGNWHGLYIEMKKPAEKPKSSTANGCETGMAGRYAIAGAKRLILCGIILNGASNYEKRNFAYKK